jgi:Protein of unknown function (DUF3800)
VRLIYLDEAGISAGEPLLCVAGVLIHGDREALKVDQKLIELVEKYIPEEDREGFIFHAKDIFHGAKYFNRERWSRETRLQILSDIAGVIEEFNLPVVASIYQKATYGQGVPEVLNAEHGQKRIIMQTASVTDCAIWADRWLETFASDENGMIIAEDADRIKPMLKKIIKLLRTPALLRANGMDQIPGVPLRRIIDTVHFAAKEDSASLQLADLCAFTFARAWNNKPIPMQVFSILYSHIKWIQRFRPDVPLPELSEVTETVP